MAVHSPKEPSAQVDGAPEAAENADYQRPAGAARSDPRVLALAEGADERRKVPGKPDDLDALRKAGERNEAATAAHAWQASDFSVSDLCATMVMRDGGGDQCGLPRSHRVHNVCVADENGPCSCGGCVL